MRIRTLVAAGAAAAAIAYLFDPSGGKARRERLRASLGALARRRSRTVDRPIPLPANLAPRVAQPRSPSSAQGPAPPVSAVPPATPAGAGASAEAPVIAGREPPVAAAPGRIPDGKEDAEIVTRITSALRERRDLHAEDLVVDVVNGTAYLAGDLHDPHTFGEIVEVTRSVQGVRRVQSLLHLPDSEVISTISAHRVGDDRRPGR